MMTDAIDLSTVQIVRSPADIASWPITATITGLTMDPRGGLTLTFAEPLPDRWKWPSNPKDPSQNYQYTVWAVIRTDDQVYAAGFVDMWQGRAMGEGSLPPILTGYVNWWGDVRRLWPGMADYRPKAGEGVGFFVSAGQGRLTDGVTSVRERSNVVVVALPAGDRGVFEFASAVPDPPVVVVPPIVPPVVVPPVREDALVALIQQIAVDVAMIKAVQAKGLMGQIARYLGTVSLKPGP